MHGSHQWSEVVGDVGQRYFHVCKGEPGKVPTLEGATVDPAPDTMIGTAGEFAARWNTMTPEKREQVWKRIQDSGDTAAKCWQADHEALAAELRALQNSRAYARTQPIATVIENLLAEVVSERMSHERTVNVLRADWERLRVSAQEQDDQLPKETQWYAYWTGVHQAVQHWSEGTPMVCPYDTPHSVVKDLVLHLVDNPDEEQE